MADKEDRPNMKYLLSCFKFSVRACENLKESQQRLIKLEKKTKKDLKIEYLL